MVAHSGTSPSGNTGSVSGNLRDEDVPAPGEAETSHPGVDVIAGRTATVGAATVRRVLPTKGHRTIGAWCFADHFGPTDPARGESLGIGPHPHIGLQTVTWLLEGSLLHRDSLGSEQSIRPGQLNLMTAGHGVAHAEEDPDGAALHGIQLWVAQPDATRDGAPAFEHHAELPHVDLDGAVATVLVGEFAATVSPARRDTDHVGVDLAIRTTTTLPLDPAHEHGLLVATGRVRIDGQEVEPGALAHLGTGRDEVRIEADAAARALLLGGQPFEARPTMWWNYVARTRDEITDAHRAWTERDEARFAPVTSTLGYIDVGPPPWE